MSRSKYNFKAVKSGIISKEVFGNYVGLVVPEKVRKSPDHAVRYAKEQTDKAVEMVSLQRYFDDGCEPEEILYLTKKQSKDFESFINSLEKRMHEGEGGLAAKPGRPYLN